MRFEVADIALGIDSFAWPRGKAGALESFAQRRAIIATPRLVDLIFRERISERAAAEIVAVMALLVRPGGNFDAELRTARVLGKGTGELEPVDYPQRAVQPAAIGLGFAVRADYPPALMPRRRTGAAAPAGPSARGCRDRGNSGPTRRRGRARCLRRGPRGCRRGPLRARRCVRRCRRHPRARSQSRRYG